MRTRWLVAGILVIVGLIWIGQGTGMIRSGSAMTDDIRWAIAGLVLAGLGSIVAIRAFLSRQPR